MDDTPIRRKPCDLTSLAAAMTTAMAKENSAE